MSTRIPKLLEIYQEIITEIRDLSNIDPYTYVQVKEGEYEATLETGESLGILLQDVEEYIESGLLSIPSTVNIKKTDAIYNLGFSINKNESQQIKSNLNTLFRILKTVIEVAEDFLKEHPDSFVVVFAEDKEGRKEVQKRDYYLEILAKQQIPGYIRGTVMLLRTPGTIFGPFRRKTLKNQHEFR